MPIGRTLRCWSVIGVFVVITTGCYPTEPQALQESSVPSAPAKAPRSSLVKSTYDKATPSSVASTNGQLDCKSPQTQAAINTCASLSAEAADKTLNQVYQQLKSTLKGSQREKLLIDAELMWVRFRDRNCVFERSSYQGGSIAPTIYYSCLEQMTKHRTEKLKNYLKQR